MVGNNNVTLVLAYSLRAIGNLTGEKDNQKASGYFGNLSRIAYKLTMNATDLLSIQAVLRIAIILQRTHSSHAATALVASTMRLCRDLGLHKQNDSHSGFSSAKVERRARTFWIAYQLDKDYSFRSGRPPTQSDDDINIHLPSEQPRDGMGTIHALDGRSVVNFFRRWVDLSVILGRTYSMLYSVQALKQPVDERSRSVQALGRLLDSWTSSIPGPFRPENITRALPMSLVMRMVILYLSYFNCIARIHFTSLQNTWITGHVPRNDFPQLKLSPFAEERCLKTARTSIRLFSLTPQGDYACTW